MKLYRLFYDDTTDLNGERIEIGKTYTKENFDEEQLFAYFNLESLGNDFVLNEYEQNFKIYEVDLNNNINAFIKDYDGEDIFLSDVNGLSGDSLTILNEIDYSIFNDEKIYKSYFVYAIKILKLRDEETIKYCLNENIDSLCNLLAMIDMNVKINQLIKNKDYQTIQTLIRKGRKEHLDIFVNSDDSLIKTLVAKLGKEEYLNYLKNDNNINVLCEVISRGRKEDIDEIIRKYPNNIDIISKIIKLGKDEYLPLILEQRKKYELYNLMIDDAIYKSYGDKTLSNLFDTTSEDIIEKILELKNEEYINYILDKGNSIQKKFILDKFHNFDHAKKLLFDEYSKVSEKAFSVLMKYGNRELFKEKLNS